MPHLIIEVSETSLLTDHKALLPALNKNLMLSQEFAALDIKSRLYIADESLVGTTCGTNAFISATLKLMPGRTAEIKQQLIEGIIETLQVNLRPDNSKEIEITVEIIELNHPEYRKYMVR